MTFIFFPLICRFNDMTIEGVVKKKLTAIIQHLNYKRYGNTKYEAENVFKTAMSKIRKCIMCMNQSSTLFLALNQYYCYCMRKNDSIRIPSGYGQVQKLRLSYIKIECSYAWLL